MPANTGLSSVPRPSSSSGRLVRPHRSTASISWASWTVAIWSSVANGASTSRRPEPPDPPVTPRSAASRIVRSTRTGLIGWEGPKSYSVSVGSKTTVAGPAHSMTGHASLCVC